jgi:hypothetical protein
MMKSTMTSKCTSVAAHFEGLADAPVRYEAHLLIQHVQGYTKSHWMLPSGNYLICIAPSAARATANKITMKTYFYFSGCFDGHGNAPVHYRMHHPMEEVQGFTRSHWMPPLGKYYVR